jgi:hypothetical protein
MNSESFVKYTEVIATMLNNMKVEENDCENAQNQFIDVTQKNTDLNLANKKYLELLKHHEDMKLCLEDALRLQVCNYQKLNSEFIKLSSDIESLWKLRMDMEFNLRAKVLLESTDIEYLKKHESNLQLEYEKLEQECMLKSSQCDEALWKIIKLESMLFTQTVNEKLLKINDESQCIEIEEYNKYVEILFSKNNSFQTKVNESEDNVIMNISEGFDSKKSEIANKEKYGKHFLEKEIDLECKFNELIEKISNFNKEISLYDKRTEDYVSVINFLITELNYCNDVKNTLEYYSNEAEHHIQITRSMVEHFESNLYSAKKEYENVCTKINCIENELCSLKSKSNVKVNKNDLESCDVSNELFDPLIDYILHVKLKLSELHSTIISGNQSVVRTKIMSAKEDILPADDEIRRESCASSLISPNIRIDLNIDILEDKTDLLNTLPKTKTDIENNVNELLDQVSKLYNKNNELVNYIALMQNYLKEKDSLVSKLNSELNEVKIQCMTLEEHNQALKKCILYSLNIDSELKNGKKTLLKEQQIVTNLINDHSREKREYEDQIIRFQKNIKKGKEWQEQLENDNVKFCLELEILKSENHSFIDKEIEINRIEEKILKTVSQSFDYLSELQDLKTQFNKKREQTY